MDFWNSLSDGDKVMMHDIFHHVTMTKGLEIENETMGILALVQKEHGVTV